MTPLDVFSSKYEIVKKLGSGLNSEVYLVKHKKLKVFRAVKIIHIKDNFSYKDLENEIEILKNLRHPNIPIIYDIEKTEDKIYIIEEYIKGETLKHRVQNKGILSKGELLNLGILISSPIIYLHNQKYPIFHLDISPNNIIINDNEVSIIDFDHALILNKNYALSKGFGSIGYCAPEQYEEKEVSEKADIYAIGACLYYAGTGDVAKTHKADVPKIWGKELKNIILECLSYDSNMRIKNVSNLYDKLINIRNKYNLKPSHNIAVVSSVQGSGATYFSLGLASYLNTLGITNIYEECNDSNHMEKLAKTLDVKCDKYGAFKYKGINIYPKNSDEDVRSATIHIEDYGSNIKKALKENYDTIILICRGNLWHCDEAVNLYEEILKFKNYKIVYNLYNENSRFIINNDIDMKNCFRFPYIENIMYESKKRDSLYKDIVKGLVFICGEKNVWLKKIKSKIKLLK